MRRLFVVSLVLVLSVMFPAISWADCWDDGVREAEQEVARLKAKLKEAEENLLFAEVARDDEHAMAADEKLLQDLTDMLRRKRFICEPEWRFKGSGTKTRSGNGVGASVGGSLPIKIFGPKQSGTGGGGVGAAVPGFTRTQNAPASAIAENLTVLSVAGEAGFARIYGGTLTSFLGGPRLSMLLAKQRFTPFFEVLVGIERGFGSSAFALQPAGGITMPLNDKAHLVIELGFRLFPTADFGSETQTRFSGGLALPLGGR